MMEMPELIEFEVGSISVTEQVTPDGFNIREEGEHVGADVEKRGHKYHISVRSWDEIRMKLAKATVESIITEAEETGDVSHIGRKIAEELLELE